VSLRSRLSDPQVWVRIYSIIAAAWVLLMIPSLLWWKDSLLWVIAMSCYANFAGSMASLQAARADVNSSTAEDLARLEQKIDAMRGRINLLTRGR